MKRKFLLLSAYIVFQSLFPCTSGAQCLIDYSNYDLILDEHFDNISAVSDLSTRWRFKNKDDPNWSWGTEDFDQNQVSLIWLDPNDHSKGKCIRLTSEKIAPYTVTLSNGKTRTIDHKSGTLQSIMNFDPDGGVQYGMFEIRAKIPTGPGAWPTFWLTSGATEIDVIDNGGNEGMGPKQLISGVIDWKKDPSGDGSPWVQVCDCELQPSNSLCSTVDEYEFTDDYPANTFCKRFGKVYYTNVAAPHTCYAGRNSLQSGTFGDKYNTYTVVWTPYEVTFFFNGKSIYTVSAGNVPTYVWPATILANLQSNTGGDPLHYMDIDYIRVYKPHDNNYKLPYIQPDGSISHDLSASVHPLPVDVNPRPNSIATNPNNPDEIFYVGVDNCVYAAHKVNGSWSVKKLQFNDGDPNTNNSWAIGDLRYNPKHDIVIYAGQNGKINMFGRSNVEPCGFYHWYLRNNWWVGNYDNVSGEPGCLQSTLYDDIFFKGIDGKMHVYYFSENKWNHAILPSGYEGGDFIKGDIVIQRAFNQAFYKGMDGKVQVFWPDNNFVYHHAWANYSNPGPSVSNAPGAMVQTEDQGLFYIGADNHIYNFSWNTATSAHEWSPIPHIYGESPAGYPNSDLARGGLAWDETKKVLYYAGFDGRIQWFAKNQQNTWLHGWLDNYWDTKEFNTYNSTFSNAYSPSLILGYDGPERSLFYTRNPFTPATENTSSTPLTNQFHISYFKNGPCTPAIDPPQKNWRNLYKGGAYVTNPAETTTPLSFKIYPNPVKDIVVISLDHYIEELTIKVSSLEGKTVLSQNGSGTSISMDISRLAAGMYFIEVSDGITRSIQRLVKN